MEFQNTAIPSATQRVLNTPELMEMILLHARSFDQRQVWTGERGTSHKDQVKEVLSFRGVSKDWQQVIDSSIRLQQTLFMAPWSACIAERGTSSLKLNPILYLGSIRTDSLLLEFTGYPQGTVDDRLHISLACRLDKTPGRPRRIRRPRGGIVVVPTAVADPYTETASWRKMLICDGPCSVKVAIVFHEPTYTERASVTTEFDRTARLSDLVHWIDGEYQTLKHKRDRYADYRD